MPTVDYAVQLLLNFIGEPGKLAIHVRRDDVNSSEVTPRIGIRLHLFSRIRSSEQRLSSSSSSETALPRIYYAWLESLNCQPNRGDDRQRTKGLSVPALGHEPARAKMADSPYREREAIADLRHTDVDLVGRRGRYQSSEATTVSNRGGIRLLCGKEPVAFARPAWRKRWSSSRSMVR